MRNSIVLLALIALTTVGASLPANAKDDWFDRRDRNHDHQWDWNEYRQAEITWCRAHHQRPLSERELHRIFEQRDRDHNGFVRAEDMRDLHPW